VFGVGELMGESDKCGAAKDSGTRILPVYLGPIGAGAAAWDQKRERRGKRVRLKSAKPTRPTAKRTNKKKKCRYIHRSWKQWRSTRIDFSVKFNRWILTTYKICCFLVFVTGQNMNRRRPGPHGGLRLPGGPSPKA